MITLDQVTFAYGDTPIVTDLSLSIPKSGAVCLFGASGCGKTTVLRLIAGLELPQSGQVIPLSDDLRINYVFQEDRLAPWLTVRENVELVMQTRDPAMVDAALDAVSLAEDADRYPDQLSGGMRRRVALARAFAYGGNLLLLDEPFNGLDDTLKVQIARAFRERFADAAIVLVTHSEAEAALFDAAVIPL